MSAIGALRALDEAGLVVPDDVAVIGFADIPAASLSHPPLTPVAEDYHRAGEMLVDTLIRQIDRKPTDTMLLTPRLVVRGPTYPPRPRGCPPPAQSTPPNPP